MDTKENIINTKKNKHLSLQERCFIEIRLNYYFVITIKVLQICIFSSTNVYCQCDKAR